MDGLPQNSVQAIAQTADGYLWLGTKGGLVRFDGVRFTTYGLASGLKALDVVDLLADGQGGLWIGTFGGGMSRLRSGRISTLTMADGLAHNSALVLAVAEPGAVWVGGSGGLQHWSSAGFRRIGEAEGLPMGEVAALARDRQDLWIAVAQKGLFFLRSNHCARIDDLKGKPILAHSLLVDDQNALWVSIGNGRVLRRQDGAWTEFTPSDGLPMSFISCLRQGAPGEIWAGSQQQGLYVWREGRFYPVTATPTPLDPAIRALHRGGDGLVWVGTLSAGLSRLSPKRVKASLLGKPEGGQVNGLAEGASSNIWVTTYGSGLHLGSLDSWLRVRAKPIDEGPFLLTALRTRHKGTYFGGVKRLHWFLPGETNLLSAEIADSVTALHEDPLGTLWIGTRIGDLLRMADGKPQTVPNGEFSGPISGLVSEPDGTLWIGTRGEGLFRWKNGQRQHWSTADGLPTDVLRTLYRDLEGTIWIGTMGGGLAWLREGRIHSVDARHRLNQPVISQILEDDDQNLWLGTNRGLIRVSKRELFEVAAGQRDGIHPLVLDESDGMLESECSGGYSPAGLRTEGGLLFFSTIRGVVTVDPKALGQFSAPPHPHIEEILLEGLRLSTEEGEITLPPGPRELEIHYTAFNFAKPERIRFRQRLEGFTTSWTEVGSERSVRFQLLPPGRYRFQVSAANENGHWSDEAASWPFRVRPFLWQTGWFQVLVAILLVGCGALLVWRTALAKVRRARARERLVWAEAEAHQQRNVAAHLARVTTLGDLSGALVHELNQPLSAILSNAQAAQRFLNQDKHDPTEIREILQDIVNDDERASEIIRRLRALLKKGELHPQAVDLNDVIREMLSLLSPELVAHGVVVVTGLAPGLSPVKADCVQLQQVLINLILNAAEAMTDSPVQARTLTICSSRRPGRLNQVSVADTGRGLASGTQEKMFVAYYTTKEKGLGLGLPLSRSIIIAHGGRLWAENRSEGGASFYFTLPEW